MISEFLYHAQDTCQQVRSLFVAKLNKKLISLKLPLGFLSIFALAGNEPEKSERALVSQSLLTSTVTHT